MGLASLGCRGRAPSAATNNVDANVRDRSIVCAGIEEPCRAACSERRPRDEHVDCLLGLRFRDDPRALEMARSLYARTKTLIGSDHRGSIDGYGGAMIPLEPALPVGADRHHLVWLASSLGSFQQFLVELAPHADAPVDFVTRPEAFLFFRTTTPEHPSEYVEEGVIGYNLDGPLNETHRTMHETLFHELFHLNDERRGGWSTALEPLFAAIVARCGDEHGCYSPFAPSDTVVPGGTYYGFDARTRHVSEYAAEVALRYYLEHEAIVFGRATPRPPFKCGAPENLVAWESIARAFFGGVDLVPDCERSEPTNDEG